MATYTLPEGFDDFDMFAFGSVLLVGAVLGFFLNFISIMAYLRVKELRTPSNFFVFNLALADLSLNCNGLASAYASYLRYWPFGPEGCQIHGVQGMTSILAGISFLGAVFNTGLPVKTLLLLWGPYVVMCIYACFENTKLVSPKIRMVLPVLAKLSPLANALLYSYGNEFYRGGIWQFLTGQSQTDKRK
uniref:G-protein coupled receptors family 1 profile domain-containing protein n=1 Tax=Astyanax mexicanus TaxID=7994 RepID=A0A8B9K127_ASTMX